MSTRATMSAAQLRWLAWFRAHGLLPLPYGRIPVVDDMSEKSAPIHRAVRQVARASAGRARSR
jgi:hypothetical protein